MDLIFYLSDPTIGAMGIDLALGEQYSRLSNPLKQKNCFNKIISGD